MSTIIDQLIYDRTSEDVERVKTLKNKIMTEGFSALTASEKTEYLAGMRGAYNYTDLNRVGQAVSYLAQRFTGMSSTIQAYREARGVADDEIFDLPYDPEDVSVSPKTDWTVSDIPTQTQMKTYLKNLSNLRAMISLPSGTPSVPKNMNGLSYTIANNIEKLLYVIDQQLTVIETNIKDLINRASLDRMLSGEGYSGEI